MMERFCPDVESIHSAGGTTEWFENQQIKCYGPQSPRDRFFLQ